MTRIFIERSPDAAATHTYDIVIIGGGIYGSVMLLTAARRGLKAILLERNDFGSETSFKSLRIIHGGLRFLQAADFGRSMGMIRERAWFLENFPDLVEVLPCLMPIYNLGLRRRSTLRMALALDNLLNRGTNSQLDSSKKIPCGYVTRAKRVKELFAQVDGQDLKGGAVWCDAHAPNTQRIIIEVLRWATTAGALALNHVQAEDLLIYGDKLIGVSATDRTTNGRLEFRAPVVINAAGPGSRDLASKFHRDFPKLFRPSLAWNVVLDRLPLSNHAIAVSRKRRHSHVYFVVPWKDKIMLGTGHGASTDVILPRISDAAVEEMLGDLNAAIPGANFDHTEISWILAGLLPARRANSTTLAPREVIIDHGQEGGLDGLMSVSGVKFAAARLVASRTLHLVARRFFGNRALRPEQAISRPPPNSGWEVQASTGINSKYGTNDLSGLRRIIEEEAVVHLDDLVLRRTTLWEDFEMRQGSFDALTSLFDWDARTAAKEVSRLERSMLHLNARGYFSDPDARKHGAPARERRY